MTGTAICRVATAVDSASASLGVVLPDSARRKDLGLLVARAEDVGAQTVWIPDGFADGQLEALTAMATVATRTRLAVGAYMLNASLRDPAIVTRVVATISTFAHSHVRILLGTGWDRHDYATLGCDFPSPEMRAARTQEMLTALKRSTDAFVEVAGVTQHSLGLAASQADGWSLSADALDTYFERAASLRRLCQEAGRSLDELRISCTAPSVIDHDRVRDLAEHGVDEFIVVM